MPRISTAIAAGLVAGAMFLAAGSADARTVTIGGYTGETITPTDSGYTTGIKSGPGRFKVRDAKTGRLVAKGKTNSRSGRYRTDEVNRGSVELPPGDYIVEVWMTDPRGKSYKGTRRIKITKDKGKSTVIERLDPQKPSEVARDEADNIGDRIDVLKRLHNKALDAAGKTKNPTAFRLAVAGASQIFRKLKDLYDQHLDKLLESMRLAAREKAAEEKRKTDLRQSSSNAVGNAQKTVIDGSIRTAVNGAHMAAGSATSVATASARPRVETPRLVLRIEPAGHRY